MQCDKRYFCRLPKPEGKTVPYAGTVADVKLQGLFRRGGYKTVISRCDQPVQTSNHTAVSMSGKLKANSAFCGLVSIFRPVVKKDDCFTRAGKFQGQGQIRAGRPYDGATASVTPDRYSESLPRFIR